MPIKYIPFTPETVQGQAVLNNFTRTRKLKYFGYGKELLSKIERGMPYYEVEKVECVGNNPKNMLIRGECVSACAYLKEQKIKIDLVYIDPPFASGADYAKKVYIRKNPKVSVAISKAKEKILENIKTAKKEMNTEELESFAKLEIDELKSFEEKMYGDIWNKEAYLNWMYLNLLAIRSVMSESASIYLHIDWHIGHYVKILMDEVFGEDNFRREVIWDNAALSGLKTKAPNWIKAHDTILYYSIGDDRIFNKQSQPHRKEYLDRFDKTDKDGKKYFDGRGEIVYLDDVIKKGKSVGDVWYDIMSFQQIPTSVENVDYNTQKPSELLKRIINASSNEFRNEITKERMIVADFFGGSGVTAKAANELKRNFIHVDVGINSIQTARDGLKEAKAEFDHLEIKDGVNLFRNPQQTMDKLKTTILGLKNEDKLDKFWEGSINDSKLGTVPVYLPNLLDHTTKVLDKYLMNRVLTEAIPNLPDNVKKVIVYFIDIDDRKAIEKFNNDDKTTEVEIELRDLKQILDDVIVDDEVEFEINESKGIYEMVFTKFISDRLRKKIDEHNYKGQLQQLSGEENENGEIGNGNGNGDGDGDEEENGNGNGNGNGKKKKKFTVIEISKDGLELIEFISLDCKHSDGKVWNSDKEIKIDKLGYLIEDGKKSKTFWDGKISCGKKPLRMKVRNIAGDEIILLIEENKSKLELEKEIKKKTTKK